MVSRMKARAGSGRISTVIILSYVVDWIVIIVAAGIGGAFSGITPNKRPFSLTDPNIAFPNVTKEKISTATLTLCGLVAPAIIIFLITMLLVPGPTVPKSTPKALIWRRKLWELHTGWLGLGLSLAAAFLITSGMKNLFGKPRPNLLSRCQPNLANASNYALGGLTNTHVGSLLVSATICQNTDKSTMNDAFRSFPSGHASFSSAGLIYLSLFIASKLAITIPFLAPRPYSKDKSPFSAFPSRIDQRTRKRSHILPSDEDKAPSTLDGGQYSEPSATGHNEAMIAARNQAAAPPVYLLVFAITPFFASIYISATRWSDFMHHGFDILFGYFIGTTTAIFAFRWYHLPISQGAGWSWGPRSSRRSFWAGIGVGSYAGDSQSDKAVVDADAEIRGADLEAAVDHQRQESHDGGGVSTSGHGDNA